MDIARVSALYQFVEKGKSGIKREEVRVIKDYGIEGDRHCFDGERQISILSEEAWNWMQEQELKGLCFSRYKANIIIKNLPEVEEKEMTLRIGEALLKISKGQKRCFSECVRYQQGADCMLWGSSWYAAGLSEGRIHVEDEVDLLGRQCVKFTSNQKK